MRMLKHDLSNTVIGCWFVTSIHHAIGHETFWVCICRCGRIHRVRSNMLRRGKSLKCKICAGFKIHPNKHAAFRTILKNAQTRRIPCSLTFNQWEPLAEKSCFYCGALPSNKRNNYKTDVPFVYSGMDRVDNNLGYSLENCVPCCSSCNSAKGSQSQSDFIKRCKSIAARF